MVSTKREYCAYENERTQRGKQQATGAKCIQRREGERGQPVCRCQIEIYYLMCRVCVNTWPRPKSKCIKFKSTYVQVNGSPLVRSLSIELKTETRFSFSASWYHVALIYDSRMSLKPNGIDWAKNQPTVSVWKINARRWWICELCDNSFLQIRCALFSAFCVTHFYTYRVWPAKNDIRYLICMDHWIFKFSWRFQGFQWAREWPLWPTYLNRSSLFHS